jgi:anaerobic ribonucleoside-triphosphate reductase activating protein
MLNTLRIHDWIPISQANGPGKRTVFWVQGCSLGCPGCFNPETHLPQAGQIIAVDHLFQEIQSLEGRVEGLTISGGEPLQQRYPLEALLKRIRMETKLSVLVFTGFSWQEIQRMPKIDSILNCVDVLLAGRFDASQRVAAGLLGSANKTIHFLTNRYSLPDLEAIPEAEIIVKEDGEILFSGIDPLLWR